MFVKQALKPQCNNKKIEVVMANLHAPLLEHLATILFLSDREGRLFTTNLLFCQINYSEQCFIGSPEQAVTTELNKKIRIVTLLKNFSFFF